MSPHMAPLVGLQQALCTHAAVTGRFYFQADPGSSFQLRSYKPLPPPCRLAPAAGSLKGVREALSVIVFMLRLIAAIRLQYHLTISQWVWSSGK